MLKLLCFLLTLLVAATFSPFARAEITASQIKLVRVLDGRWISCNRPFHINRSTWSIQGIEIQPIESKSIRLKALVQFSQCQMSSENPVQVSWKAGNPLAKFSKTNPNGEKYTMWHEGLEVQLVNLDNDQVSSIKPKPEAESAIDHTFRIGQLLTPSEIEKLANGETVATSIGIFPVSSARVEKVGKDTKTYSQEAWGRFNIQFLLKRN